MLIMFGKTVAVVGREPDMQDHAFIEQAIYWHVEWVKAGRPSSNPRCR